MPNGDRIDFIASMIEGNIKEGEKESENEQPGRVGLIWGRVEMIQGCY